MPIMAVRGYTIVIAHWIVRRCIYIYINIHRHDRERIQDTRQQPQDLLQAQKALDNDSPFQVDMGIERKAA